MIKLGTPQFAKTTFRIPVGGLRAFAEGAIVNELLMEASRWARVAERKLPSGYEGFYAPGLDLIVLDSRLTDVQRRCVLAHEISHARHHDAGCRCDRWTERRADIEAAVMLISPLEYAYAEAVYEGNTVGMARELNVLPWAIDAFRERLRDDPRLVVQ